MENIVKAAVGRGASDVHIKAGDVFRARIDGELVPLTKQRLTPDQTKAIVLKLIPVAADRERIDTIRDYDCSWGSAGVGRFRVNILRQRSSFMAVLRVIPFEVPTIDGLQLPKVMTTLAESPRGLLLVAGGSGDGKTSTMAAIVNHINQNQNRHIVTLESPIEYLHRDLKSSVTQREIGPDTADFPTGVRAALRQDPDVIVIGDLQEVRTADLAMKAAETGKFVIAGLPAGDVTGTMMRLVAMFPGAEQEVARMRLADALLAVVSQRLVARADGEGRCAAQEVFVAIPELRDMVRDRNRWAELPAAIEKHRGEHGMQSFHQHLVDLVESDVVTLEAAKTVSGAPDELERLLEGSGVGKKGGGRENAS